MYFLTAPSPLLLSPQLTPLLIPSLFFRSGSTGKLCRFAVLDRPGSLLVSLWRGNCFYKGLCWSYSGFLRRCKDWEVEFSSLEYEIFEFMQSSGKPEAFPTKEELIAAGREDLVNAIANEGGWLAFGWDLNSVSREIRDFENTGKGKIEGNANTASWIGSNSSQSDESMYEDAWKVFESMERENIHPDHVTCSIMVTVMRELGHSAKDAWQFFEEMNRKGIRWSEEILGALMKSFCAEGLMREALIIQSEMEKKGVSSDAVVYNTLMDAYCKSNNIEAAEGLSFEMIKVKGIKPTAATFNILMHAYSRRMQPNIIEKLLEEMQAVGLKPNAESYTCLINAYGTQKKMSGMAADVFLKMLKVGIKPNSHSYTALIHAYSVSGLHESACMAFENMLREGIKPSVETYTTLLDVLRRVGDTQKLMKLFMLMMRES